MKKILCFALALMMCLTLAASALAETATYASTQAVMDAMDANGLKYELLGVVDSGDEVIHLTFNGDDTSFDFYLFFSDDQELTDIFVWDVISFNEADFTTVALVCNALNTKYRFTKFYAEDDNTVTCDMNVIYRDHDVGEIVVEALYHVASIVDECYEMLAPYNK